MKKIIQYLLSVKDAKKMHQFTLWLNDLAAMDDLAALKFSTNQLALTVNRSDVDNALSLSQKLKLLLEVETLNHLRLEKLSTQFASVENIKAELANDICETCYNYCRQSYICHLKIIETLFDANKGDSGKNQSENTVKNDVKLSGDMPVLIVARALNAAFNMIKWRLFNQANLPANVWLQTFVLYRIAAREKLLNTLIEVFDLAQSTTLAAHFVQIWMLGQLTQASLQKQHIEITSRILNTLLTRTYISNKLTPEQYLFYVNLDKDVSAKRMRNFEQSANCRYWELDELEKQLAVAITVSGRGEIPQSLAFSKIDHAKQLNETLKILLDEWKKLGYVRQRRRVSRQASSKTARVNAGIADICNQVHQANQISSGLKLSRNGTSLDDRLRAHTVLKQTGSLSVNSGSLDVWTITDESLRGLGTRINKYGSILTRPDKLIGLMVEEDPNRIIIGMIRSVKPTQGNQLRVGVEIISHYPAWVQLRQISENEAFPPTVAEVKPLAHAAKKTASSIDSGLFSGIYLPIEAGLSDTSTLILPKINFRACSSYAVTFAGSTRNVFLENPIESYDDWVKLTFPF